MATVVDTLVTEFKLSDKYSGAAKGIEGATDRVTKSIGNASRAFLNITAGVGIAEGIFMALGGAAMKQAADFEALTLGLQAYAGSAQEATEQLRRLQEVAKMPGLGFQEAIQGATRLEAAGFNFRLAERSMLAFGNALALVGGGKADLDGVLLALTQIAAKGQITAEDINQIAERVPQIREAMKGAFGTANTEALQKMGLSTEAFILGITGALEKLPKATGGAKNAFENFGDVANRVIVKIGTALNAWLLPALSKVSDFMGFLADSGAIGGAVAAMTKTAGGKEGANALADKVIEFIAHATAVISHIPEFFDVIKGYFGIFVDSIRGIYAGFVSFMNQVGGTIVSLFHAVLPRFFEAWKTINPNGEASTLKKTDQLSREWAAAQTAVSKDTQKYLADFKASQSKPPEDLTTGGPGGFREHDAVNQTASNTAQLVQLQQKTLDIQRSILGGGNIGGYATSAARAAGGGHRGSSPSRLHTIVNEMIDEIYRTVGGGHDLVARQGGYGRR